MLFSQGWIRPIRNGGHTKKLFSIWLNMGLMNSYFDYSCPGAIAWWSPKAGIFGHVDLGTWSIFTLDFIDAIDQSMISGVKTSNSKIIRESSGVGFVMNYHRIRKLLRSDCRCRPTWALFFCEHHIPYPWKSQRFHFGLPRIFTWKFKDGRGVRVD